MSTSTKEQTVLSNLVVRFGELEKMLTELAKHTQKPLVRVSERAVTTYIEPYHQTRAFITVTAIDQADSRLQPTIYLWYGASGSFDEMQGQAFSPAPRTREIVAKAAELNEEAIRKVVIEELGDKADVRDGVFVLPDNCYSGYGTTKLVDMAAPLKLQRQAAG